MNRSEQSLVDFIGIGAPKCGTTWIAQCLAQHPDICFSKIKEPHFFNREHQYTQGLAYYERQFAHCGHGKLRGEYTVNYLYYEKAARRIREHAPEVKLIACFRNPIDRAYSNWRYEKARAYIPKGLTFEQGLKKYAHYTDLGFYARNLEPWFNYFPREQFLFLLYDDLECDAAGVLRRIFRFLAIDETFQADSSHERVNFANQRTVKSHATERAIREMLFWSYRHPLLTRFAKSLRINKPFYFLRYRNKIRLDVPSPVGSMDPKTWDFLRALFAEDVDKLSKILGRNLDSWFTALTPLRHPPEAG